MKSEVGGTATLPKKDCTENGHWSALSVLGFLDPLPSCVSCCCGSDGVNVLEGRTRVVDDSARSNK